MENNNLPGIKSIKPGLSFVQFKEEYNLLLGNYRPDKYVYYNLYGRYCFYNTNKL